MEKYVETVGGGKEEPKVIGHRVVDGRKIIISETKNKFKNGWIGMHKGAAKDKSVDVKTNISNNEIILFKGLPKKIKRNTLHHELIEKYLMDRKGLAYKQAHKVSLKFEGTKITPQEAWKWYIQNSKR